jgi:hypothetical protein
MLLRLSLLALFGISTLRADVCGGLPSDAPKGLEYWPDLAEDNPPPLPFHLSVKRGGPDFRITVRPVSFSSWMNREGFDQPWWHHGIVYAGDIEVARCEDGKQLQLLPITAWQPINFGRSFHAEDVNFDGYLDFSVLTEFAGKFRSRFYWVYDPRSGLFVENELTRKLGENCLRSGWSGGCWKASHIDFDQGKREIRTYYILSNAVCPISSSDFSGDRYRVEDNRLILIHKEEVTSDNCEVTYSDLIGGTMRVTQILRFDAQGHRLK